MGYSVTDTAVMFSQGRGRAKVSLALSFRDLERWAKRQKIDTAKLMKRSFGRACFALKRKFQKVISNAGGVEGVPKFKDFEAFTKELRAVEGRTTPMGGVLADASRIVSFKKNGWQMIGWPDELADWAVNFQDGVGGPSSERYFTDPDYRHLMHKRGIREIPREYVHNPRRVIPEPFGAYVEQHLETWARGTFYKELAKQMMKTKGAA